MRQIFQLWLLVWLAGAPLQSAEPGDLQWHLLNFGGGHRTDFSNRGVFQEFYIAVGDPHRDPGKFGPIAIWQPENSSQFVMLSQSLSGVDEAIRAEGRANPQEAERTVPLYLDLYRGTERAYSLIGPQRESFLVQLKAKVAKEIYDRISVLISEARSSPAQGTWEISFSVVTWRGAIERRTYSGTRNPLSIRKEVVEVIAPAGTVPEFDYNPTLLPDKAKPWGNPTGSGR